MLSYIQNNPQETQRLVGVKYDQLEQLIKQAIALDTEKQQNKVIHLKIKLLFYLMGEILLI